MAANSAIVGTGMWSEVGPAGITITDPTNATTTVTGLAAGSSATLRWTISNGTCAPSTDDVVIRNDVQPVADADERMQAGFDICGSLVYPNAVAATGTGTWSKVSTAAGRVGVQHRIERARSGHHGAFLGTYVLRWTDVNLTCSDFDEITVNFYQPHGGGRGADIFSATIQPLRWRQQCDSGRGMGGRGRLICGHHHHTDPTNATTTVTGLAAGSSATLRWTVSNGTCAPEHR